MVALRLREIRSVKSCMGMGLGSGMQFWDVTSSLRGSLCYREKSGHREAGAGACAGALGSAGNGLMLQCGTGG